ncbi:MAG TPA: hypothetical protein VFE46_02230 [Pirellulales bacterium]|nr:hypothetical protein [Pirellulales bacterium]
MKSSGTFSAKHLWAIALAATVGLVGIQVTRASDATATKTAAKPASGSPADTKPAHTSSTSAQTSFPEKALPAKVLFITSKTEPNCDKELGRLMRPNGDFEKLRAAGWKIGKGSGNHLQIVDKDDVPELIKQLGKQEYPTVASVDKEGQVVRYFRFGCTTPLDMWTFGFLAKGIDERPAGFVMEAAKVDWTGHYPLRGNHWSVEGNWSPTKEETVTHLHGPNHQSQLIPEWHIEAWSLEELRSLHDDLHEKYDTGTYRENDNSSGGGADYLKFKGKG